jgi:hypothetical protein
MYLIHRTDNESINKILKDGYLKSNKMTGNINEGDGVYDRASPYIYFSVIKKLSELEFFEGLVIDISFLYHNNFWVSTGNIVNPNKKLFISDDGKRYCKKYRKNYSKYKSVLEKLYNDGEIKYLNQVAIKGKLKLKDILLRVYGDIDKKLLGKYDNVKLLK